jgi:hypothetical protein
MHMIAHPKRPFIETKLGIDLPNRRTRISSKKSAMLIGNITMPTELYLNASCHCPCNTE